MKCKDETNSKPYPKASQIICLNNELLETHGSEWGQYCSQFC